MLRKAAYSAANTVATGAALFFTYRLLIGRVGLDGVGVWALLNGVAGFVRLGEFGVSISGAKAIAEATERQDGSCAARIVGSGFILCIAGAAFFGIMVTAGLMVGFPGLISDPSTRSVAIGCVTSACIAVVTAPLRAALDGYHQVEVRQFTIMTQQLVFLVVGVFLVMPERVETIVGSQIISTVVAALLQFSLVWRVLKIAPSRWRFDLGTCRSLWRTGTPLQGLLVVQQLYEPLTKLLLHAFGEYSSIARFEMANRVVVQVRLILVSAMEVLVPHVAALAIRSRNAAFATYQRVGGSVMIVAPAAFAAVWAAMPAVSVFWLGEPDIELLVFGIILSAGWFANVVAAPAYFHMIAHDMQKVVFGGHLAMGLINLTIGAAFGTVLSSYGVVIGWSVALVAGSAYLIRRFHVTHTQSLPRPNLVVLTICAVSGSLATVVSLADPFGHVAIATISLLCALACIASVLLTGIGRELASSIGARVMHVH